jgi:hypothetical protein
MKKKLKITIKKKKKLNLQFSYIKNNNYIYDL